MLDRLRELAVNGDYNFKDLLSDNRFAPYKRLAGVNRNRNAQNKTIRPGRGPIEDAY